MIDTMEEMVTSAQLLVMETKATAGYLLGPKHRIRGSKEIYGSEFLRDFQFKGFWVCSEFMCDGRFKTMFKSMKYTFTSM